MSKSAFFRVSFATLYALLSLMPVYSSTLQAELPETLVIARGEGSYPPLEIYQDGVYSGIHIEVTRAVAQRLGVKIKYRDLPWARAINEVKEGKVDAITYLGFSSQRNEFAYFLSGNVLSYSTTVFIVLKDRYEELQAIFDGSLESIKGHVVGVQHGFVYGENFENAQFLNKSSVLSESDVAHMLEKHRHDYAIMSYQEFSGYQGDGKLKGVVDIEPPISKDPQYLAFSRNTKNDAEVKRMAQLFSDEMVKFKKTQAYRNILISYRYHDYDK